MKTPDEIEQLYTELKELGLNQVETRLAQGVYGNPQKKLVESWIKTQKEDLDTEHKKKNIATAEEANKM